jgi:peptide/nickel transport system permease protein
MPGALRNGVAEWAAGLREWWPPVPEQLKEGLAALKDPVLLIGTVLVLALVAVAILAPRLAPFAANHATPAYQDAQGRIYAAPSGPDSIHPFGTDQVGRDMLSVLLYGTRYALLFAAVVVPARFLLALLLGLAAAWRGGIWDRLLRWLSVFFSAVPLVILPLVAIGVFNQVFSGNVGICFFWGVFWLAMPAVPRLAGSVRQMALTVFASPFLESAVAAGAGTWRILFRHVLPQLKSQLVTMMALEVPLALTMTAALGYFGVAVGGSFSAQEYGGLPAIPEWGSVMAPPVMIIMAGQWWLWTPFAALFIATLAFNLFGEGLRRRFTGTTEWRLQA